MSSFAAIRRVLFLTMLLNLMATAIKLSVGYFTGSLSMVADGLDALFDSASNVVGVAGIYLAARPPDKDHPYGHRKFETLAAMGIATLLFDTCIEIVRGAIHRLANPQPPEIIPASFVALLVSMVINAFTAIYERRQGQRLRSDVLLADASHTAASILVSLSVAGGLLAVRAGYPAADPLLAILIAGVIAKIGVDIVRESTRVLSDAAAIDPRRIARVALAVEGVKHVEHVRSRGHADDVQIDLHVQVDPQLGILPAHAIGHEVKDRLLSQLEGVRDVTVHVEPAYPKPGEHDAVDLVRRAAAMLPATVHNIHVLQTGEHLSVDLDLEVEQDLTLAEAHALADRLERAIRSQVPGVVEVSTHIEPKLDEPVDARPSDVARKTIENELTSVVEDMPEVFDCHAVSVREVAGHIYASIRCLCDGRMSVARAHQIANELEHRLHDRIPHLERVLVHIEPCESLSSKA